MTAPVGPARRSRSQDLNESGNLASEPTVLGERTPQNRSQPDLGVMPVTA